MKSKKRIDRENKRTLSSAQEVAYNKQFKRADRAGGFLSRDK
ncbi:YfhE family protein [Bacillus solimangrovi]|uniref:YfhE family protein n=1 Tax=Bacillus solimangrovi TaxID=1305675 RepID=A0A1E5LBC2_9BACI|nr:YfhE family protein [Bacillus solimangrovi]OEH91383.1 YfhE family protein [Bacillus solimangrovi]